MLLNLEEEYLNEELAQKMLELQKFKGSKKKWKF